MDAVNTGGEGNTLDDKDVDMQLVSGEGGTAEDGQVEEDLDKMSMDDDWDDAFVSDPDSDWNDASNGSNKSFNEILAHRKEFVEDENDVDDPPEMSPSVDEKMQFNANNVGNPNEPARPQALHKREKKRCWVCPTCDCKIPMILEGSQTLECINKGCNGFYSPATARVVYSSNWQREALDFGSEGQGRQQQQEAAAAVAAAAAAAAAAAGTLFAEPQVLADGKYQIWDCPLCGYKNSAQWRQCGTCRVKRAQMTEEMGCVIVEYAASFKPVDPDAAAISIIMQEDQNRVSNYNWNNNNYYNNNSNNNSSNNSNNNNSNHRDGWNSGLKAGDWNLNDRAPMNGKKNTRRGDLMLAHCYPSCTYSVHVWENTSGRLVNKLGLAYNNAYSQLSPRPWGCMDAKQFVCNRMALVAPRPQHQLASLTLQSGRNAAVNDFDGNIALLWFDDSIRPGRDGAAFLSVYECGGSFDYRVACCLDVTKCFEDTKTLAREMLSKKEENDNKATNDKTFGPKNKEMIGMTRIRFVGDDIFMFCWSLSAMKLFQFKVKKTKSLNGSIEWNLTKFNEFEDKYWMDQSVMDVDVITTDDNDFFAILFAVYVGYYQFDRNDANAPMQWFHASQYCKNDGYNVDAHSFKVIGYDHTSDDNLVCTNKVRRDDLKCIDDLRNAIKQKRGQDDSPNVRNVLNGNKKFSDTDNTNNNNNNSSSSSSSSTDSNEVNMVDMNDMNDFGEKSVSYYDYRDINVNFKNIALNSNLKDEEEKVYEVECDWNVNEARVERRSHRFYNYISFENELIGHHPSCPNWERVNWATNHFSGGSSLFSVSKMFGMFYSDQNRLIHCNFSKNEDDPTARDRSQILYQSDDWNRYILYLAFDESYGVSGRLMMMTINNQTGKDIRLEGFVIESDLVALKESLCEILKDEVPGALTEEGKCKVKMYFSILEFLYGSRFVACANQFAYERHLLDVGC